MKLVMIILEGLVLMSEHLQPEWLQIPHEDHEAMIAINGLARTFSTADTAVWVYPEQYKMFNSVIQEYEDDTYAQWFGLNQEDLDTLHEAGITFVYPPYPSNSMIRQFWAVEMADYDRELKQIEETGDLPPAC